MEMDFPSHFRCPISRELMKDPVTISTGVTYDRRNIEKWLFNYQKTTCPATMQPIDNLGLTPNHNLKRLITSWETTKPCSSSSPASASPSAKHAELVSLLNTTESTPFKVSSLKKLRALLETDEEMKANFIHHGGVDVLVPILCQILLTDMLDFLTFRACEEALGVLHMLPIIEEDDHGTIQSLSKLETVRAIAIMLQRGSAEARFHAIVILQNIIRADIKCITVMQDQCLDMFKSLMELVSDEICTKASSRALEVIIEMLAGSKKMRLKAVEAGAVQVLIELLPEANRRSKCEKILMLIKLLCECAEGRLAFVEHGMGIAAVSKKLLVVSDDASKIIVKTLWLISVFHPTERVVEDMLVLGAVKKLLPLLRIGIGRWSSSAKEKVVKILRQHGSTWMRHPCCPHELKECLGS